MKNYILPFMLGAVFSILIFFFASADGEFLGINASKENLDSNISSTQQIKQAKESVTIMPLPHHLALSGVNVEFKGKQDIPLKLEGAYGRSLRIVSFQATGENAHKSRMKIVWKDGATEVIAPGVVDVRFAEDRLVKSIIISGYSMRERKIFKDSSRPGVLNWEIRYEPVM